MHGPMARVLPTLGGGGGCGGSKRRKHRGWFGLRWGGRGRNPHMRPGSWIKVPKGPGGKDTNTSEVKVRQRWAGTVGTWYAGCNMFLFFSLLLCCFFPAAAALGFIDIIPNGCCSCGVTGQAPCPDYVIYYQERKPSSLSGEEQPAVATRRPGCSCSTWYGSTSTFLISVDKDGRKKQTKCPNCLHNQSSRKTCHEVFTPDVNQVPETYFDCFFLRLVKGLRLWSPRHKLKLMGVSLTIGNTWASLWTVDWMLLLLSYYWKTKF